MIYDIVFIVVLALFAVCACYYGAGVILVEYQYDKSPKVAVGRDVFFWGAAILFIILISMAIPL